MGKGKPGLFQTELRKSGKPQNGLREFCVEGTWIFLIRTLIWKGQKKQILFEKDQKIVKTISKNFKQKMEVYTVWQIGSNIIIFYMIFYS